MKQENISDALGLLDENMIAQAIMVREKRKRTGTNKIGKIRYVLAACVCLACISGAACLAFFHKAETALPQEDLSFRGQILEGSSGLPEIFVEVSSLIASEEGIFTEDARKEAAVPIEQYRGIYTEVPSVGNAVLSESIGKSIEDTEGWYCISGHSDLQYLIRNEEQEFSLWKFQCFDSGEYPYSDVLKLVYQIDSASAITEIKAAPATMDNTEEGMKIQKEIGIWNITDRDAIETMYAVLSGMTCYGSSRWDLIDYGDAEAASDGEAVSHQAVRLGRYLSITLDSGNVIDGLKYTAVSHMFYEFSGIAYQPLSQEQAAAVWEVIGLTGAGKENVQGYEKVKVENQEEDILLLEVTNTSASREYVTELQEKISNAMVDRELEFVILSVVYEDPYRLSVVVTSDSEEDLQKLLEFDTLGGVLEVKYTTINNNTLE